MVGRTAVAVEGVPVEEGRGEGAGHWFAQVLAGDCEVDEPLESGCVADDPVVVGEVGVVVRFGHALVGLAVKLVLDGAVDAGAGLEVVERVVARDTALGREERSLLVAGLLGQRQLGVGSLDVGQRVVVELDEPVLPEGRSICVQLRRDAGQLLEVVQRELVAVDAASSVV